MNSARTGRFHFMLALGLALGLAACSDDKPEFLLPQDQLADILKEMQIAYAGVDATEVNEKKRRDKYAEMNTIILEKHKVSADTFLLTYDYYQNHPELLDSIYKQVIEKLNLEILPLQKKDKPRPLPVPGEK